MQEAIFSVAWRPQTEKSTTLGDFNRWHHTCVKLNSSLKQLPVSVKDATAWHIASEGYLDDQSLEYPLVTDCQHHKEKIVSCVDITLKPTLTSIFFVVVVKTAVLHNDDLILE